MPINGNIYSVNWNKLISWLMPTALFKPKMFGWLKSLAAPISTLHGDLLAFRKQKKYELEITGQVCKLETLLNDRFDNNLRRIYILDGEKSKRRFIYSKAEQYTQPVYTVAENRPFYIYQQNEITTTTYHFIVKVPSGLVYDADVMVSVLSSFKMPSKKFDIQSF